MNIADRVVIVTGASAGLGLECCRQFVAQGARVFGLARRQQRLTEIEQQLGKSFTGIVCDVTDVESVQNAVREVSKQHEQIDVLINNAGMGTFGPVEEISAADWDTMMEVNLRGVFLCTKAVVPFMKAQNARIGFGGHIVNVASVAGLLGNPEISAYNVTKFGVRGFSDALMKELRSDGIKVTCVYPGSIQTEFFDVAGVEISPNPMTAEDVAATILSTVDTPDNYLISEIVMRPLRPRG